MPQKNNNRNDYVARQRVEKRILRSLKSDVDTTFADAATVKAALQALETSIESVPSFSSVSQLQTDTDNAEQDIDDLEAMLGAAADATDLGTFTGATIADASTVKVALQALETALEANDTELSGVEKFAYATVLFSDTNVTIVSLPAAAQVTQIMVKVLTSFDGTTPTIEIGYTGTQAALSATTDFDVTDASAVGNPQVMTVWFDDNTFAEDIKVYVGGSGATAGSAKVGIRYVEA